MRLLFLVNDPASPPGILLEEAQARGADCEQIFAPKSTDLLTRAPLAFPQTHEGYDGIVVMGGVMSVNDGDGDDNKYPFIEKTRALLRDFHAAGKPIMGVCLGAQLLASAFGARVYQMAKEEWGFVPQNWLSEAEGDALLHDAESGLGLMEWHSDTFDLPYGAVHLAGSATCANQGFRLGQTTYGFQFHLEITQETLEKWASLRAKAKQRPADEIMAGLGDAGGLLMRQQIFARRVMRRWLGFCKE